MTMTVPLSCKWCLSFVADNESNLKHHYDRKHPNAAATAKGPGAKGYRPPLPTMHHCTICDLYLESNEAIVISEHVRTGYHIAQQTLVHEVHTLTSPVPRNSQVPGSYVREVNDDDKSRGGVHSVGAEDRQAEDECSYTYHSDDDPADSDDETGETSTCSGTRTVQDADWLQRNDVLRNTAHRVAGEVFLIPFNANNPQEFKESPGPLSQDWRNYARYRVVDVITNAETEVRICF